MQVLDDRLKILQLCRLRGGTDDPISDRGGMMFATKKELTELKKELYELRSNYWKSKSDPRVMLGGGATLGLDGDEVSYKVADILNAILDHLKLDVVPQPNRITLQSKASELMKKK